MHTVVGIDIETTSLDATAGEIIEIAAIRYDVDTQQELARFVSLARPHKPLQPITTQITGLTDDDLRDQPAFSEIAQAVTEFIGTDLIFAHNATFDVQWLIRHGVDISKNKVWDTFPLSGIAWPETESYNLGALAAMLDISVESEHRAAADVEVTWQLLLKIREALHVSNLTFDSTMALLTAHELTQYVSLFTLYTAKDKQNTKVKKSAPSVKKPRTLNGIFGTTGLLSRHLPHYRAEPQQEEMAAAVTDLITGGGIGLMESQAGVGKEVAYLVPALLSAQQSQRTVISTYTNSHIDQLILRDLPQLQSALGTAVQVATLKERRNYVCSQRLQRLLASNGQLTQTDVFILLKIIYWLAKGGSGEIDRLNISHQETVVLSLIHADAISCKTSCGIDKACPYHKAHAVAGQADIVIINHTLLLSSASESRSPLTATTLIVDEAHHLESAIRSSTRIDLSPERIEQITAAISQILSYSPNHSVLHASLTDLVKRYHSLLNLCGSFIGSCSTQDRIRLTPQVRKDTKWQPIKRLTAGLCSHSNTVHGVATGMMDIAPASNNTGLTTALHDLRAFTIELQMFITGSSDRIQWMELSQLRETSSPTVEFHDVALSVSSALLPVLAQSSTMILTSKTLKVSGDFSYIKQRLGLYEGREFSFASPLNYHEQMMIYMVTDMPDPNSALFNTRSAEVIATAARLLGGKTLGLFTAKRAIKETYAQLLELVNTEKSNNTSIDIDSNIASTKLRLSIFAQGITGGKANILRRFTTTPHSILLGTDSFWEEANISGDCLSCVVIPKLPFSSPHDPVQEALAQDDTSNAFHEINVPQMIIQMRQGIGRLIRSDKDKGIVIILDPRLHRQSYGKSLLASLPDATIVTGIGAELPAAISDWFTKKDLQK